jgi:hypothetical protein
MIVSAAIAAISLFLFTPGAMAQESADVLKKKLQQRDMVIRELLDRVEALERRVGVERLEPAPAQAPAPDATADAANGVKPGTIVVSEADAERALERSLTRDGAVLLPSGVLEVEPSFTYSRNEDRTPAFVSTMVGIVAGETERNSNSVTGNLALRLGLPWDSQLEVGVPYRWREVETVTNVGFTPVGASTESGAGLGDVSVGLAKTLLHEGLWAPDLVGRVTWNSDTGEESDNGLSFGSGFHEVRGSLSAIKRQDPIAFLGGLSYQHAFEKDQVQPGPTWSASFGSYVALSPESSVRFLLSGGYQDDTELAGTEIPGSDRTFGTFTVGGSTLVAPGTLLSLSAGIGLTDDSDDFSIILSMPIRLGSLY